MSGFEVAGLVLGAFPIALHLLDDYREMAKRAGLWYRIRLEHAKCRNEVEFQRVTLNSHMRQLILPLLVDDAKTNELLADPGGESWKEPAIETLLQDRLGHTYDLYLDYIKGMEEIMIRLNKELSMDSGPVQEQLKSPKAPMAKSGLKSVTAKAEFQLYKVKFSNGEAKRKELLGQLQEYNDKLEKLLSTSDRDAQLKKQRTAVQYKTSIDATLCSFWKQASKLFHALASAWNCTCAKDQHLAKLLLQHRTTKKAEFDIMFSSRGASGWQIQHTRISEDDDGDCQMTTTKGATPTANASVTATSPVRQPGHRQNSAGIKLKSAMRTATKSKLAATAGGQNQVISQSSVTIGTVQISTTVCPSSQATPPPPAISLTLSAQPIVSLCLSLQQPVLSTGSDPGRPTCYGYLTSIDDDDNDNSNNPSLSSCNFPVNIKKFYLHTLSHQQTGPTSLPTITLDQILTGGTAPMTRKQRYLLALTLASSFLQLLDTPWLPVNWKKSDIVLLAHDSSHRPYLKQHSLHATSLPRQQHKQQTQIIPISTNPNMSPPTTTPSNLAALNRSLDHLAILLLELCFGSPLESQPCRKNWPQGSTDAERQGYDILAARDWQFQVEEEAGREYFEAVAWCLGGVIRHEKWRADMLQSVIGPLSRCGGWVSGSVTV